MLTQKQERFCQEYIKSGNASEAYRASYDAQNCAPATVNRAAKTLMDNSKIAARLAELRKPAVDQAVMTLAIHLQTLAELREAAKVDGKYDAAVKAEELRGKASGFYVEKKESGPPGAFSKDERTQTREKVEGQLFRLGVVKVEKTRKVA